MTSVANEDTTAKIDDERLAFRGIGQRLLVRPEIVGVMTAGVLYLFFWAVTRPFGNAGGAATVLDLSAAPLGIMAVAVAMLMIGGEFDLSAGAMTGAMAIVIVLLVKETGELGGAGLSYWFAIPSSLAVALGIGWLNGRMVEKTALPSFIVTLATFFVLRGVKLAGSKIMVDQIQVGRADEGAHYEFWRKIFGAVWERQDHVWEARDGVYTVLVVLGGLLVLFGLFEFSFRRATAPRRSGLPTLVAGLVGIVGGILLAHGLDGSDWLVLAVLAVSGLVATYGLCTWRYEPLRERGALMFRRPVMSAIGAGIGLIIVGVIVALVLDPYDGTDMIPFVTEQGVRAIVFMAAMIAAVVSLSIGTYRAREASPMTKAGALCVLSAATIGLALFVQAESESAKFRTQLFGVMCVFALIFLAWAAASVVAELRRFDDVSADRLARRATLIGTLSIVVGMTIKLLFAVQAEIDAGASSRLALFSIRTIWMLVFAGVMTFVLRKTPFGGWTFAVGGNMQAARQVGVPAERTKRQLFMLVAFAAWLVGMLLTFRLNTIQAGTGNGEEFEYIIAAVVGGTLLTGGYGSAIGAVIGAFIMAMSQQGPSYAGWNTDWRFVFLGVILLGSAYANGYVRKRAEAAR